MAVEIPSTEKLIIEELAPPIAMYPELSCCTFEDSASAPSGLVVLARLFSGNSVIIALFLESEMDASSVLIWSGPAVTSIVVPSAAARFSVTVTRRSCRASSAMPFRLVVAKPACAAVTVYRPGLRFSNRNAPEPSVTLLRVVLWSTERSVTAVPGICAPVLSAAMPRMLPKVDWAATGPA